MEALEVSSVDVCDLSTVEASAVSLVNSVEASAVKVYNVGPVDVVVDKSAVEVPDVGSVKSDAVDASTVEGL